MVQQLRCQALFASGCTLVVTDFLNADEYHIKEENEAITADLSWFCGQLFGFEIASCLFDRYFREVGRPSHVPWEA